MNFNTLNSNLEFFDLVVNSLNNIIFIIDNDINILEYNNTLIDAFKAKKDITSESKFGDVLGCSYAYEDKKSCGNGKFCKRCPIRDSFTEILKNKSSVTQLPIEKDFYIGRDKEKKHFLMSAQYTRYKEKEVAIVVLDDVTELTESKLRLEKMVATDYLTGVYNRRHLFSELNNLVISSERYKTKLSLLMIDIDHFKKINDTYGHQIGDKALIKVAHFLKETLRKCDIVGRYGGEEFMIILPHTGIDQAYHCAERIRKKVEKLDLGIPHNLTISSGVSEYYDGSSVNDLIRKADLLLYEAKSKGRNRTES